MRFPLVPKLSLVKRILKNPFIPYAYAKLRASEYLAIYGKCVLIDGLID